MIARHHAVPFYVAAPFTSIDFSIPSGEHIVIEERPECEMTCIGDQRIAASGQSSPMNSKYPLLMNCVSGISVWNPAFDVTPAELITAIITEKGIFTPAEIVKLKVADNGPDEASVST